MTLELNYFINAIWKGKQATVQASKDIGGVGTAAESSDKKTKGFVQTASDLGKGLKEAGGAGLAFIATFKQALDFANEGQQIKEVEERFEALTESIGANVSVLEDLRQVTLGQASDFDLMSQANTLTAMGLANTREELLKHFDIVSRLKKPNEEFGASLENWSLLLANQSIERLDSFGISSGRVRERVNELTKGVNALDRETAFVTATLEEAEKAIERTGRAGNITGNSFERLRVRADNFTNSIKVQMATGLEPWVNLVLGDYSQAIDNLIEKNKEAAIATGDVSDIYRQTDFDLDATIDTIIKASTSFEDLIANFEEAGFSQEFITDAVHRNIDAINEQLNTQRELERQQQALENQRRLEIRDRIKLDSFIDANTQTLISNVAVYGTATSTMASFTDGMIVGNKAVESGTRLLREDAEATQQLILAQEEQAELSRMLAEQQAAYNATLGDYFTIAVQTGATTDDLGQTFFDLSAKYGATDTALAALGLGFDLFDEKAAEQGLKMAVLTAQADLLAQQYANNQITVAELREEWARAIDEVDELTLSINESTGSVMLFEEGMVGAGDSVEALTQKNADLSAEMAGLTPEMTTATGGVEGFSSSVMMANDQVRGFVGNLNEIDGRQTNSQHTHVTEFVEVGNQPPVGTETTEGFLMSRGGMVRGGMPGRDSVPTLLQPGEIVVPVSATNSLESATNFLSRFVRPMHIEPVSNQSPVNNTTNVGGQSVVINVQDNKQAAIVGARVANSRRMQLQMTAFGGNG